MAMALALRRSCWVAALLGAALLPGCQRADRPAPPPAPTAQAPAVEPTADFAGQTHSDAVARVADWAVRTRDPQGEAFAVIDKPAARLYVFDAGGRLAGAAPVLVGAAIGDETVPGIGDKPIAQVKPDERTTPAGRFVAEHGTNLRHEHVIWIDYDAAVSMHPVLTTNPAERRLERLDSPDPAEHRISYGCVNVPTQFFADVVLATLGPVAHPVIYVLPDVRPLAAVFPGLAGAPGRTPGESIAAHEAGGRGLHPL